MDIHIDDPRLIELLSKFENPSVIINSFYPIIQHCVSLNKDPLEFLPSLIDNLFTVFPDHYIHSNENHISVSHYSSPTFFVQSKMYNHNIPPKEVDEFINLCKSHQVSGILCSETSGISNHSDLSFQVLDSTVIVFIHNLNSNQLKIKYAQQIINSITNYIQSFDEPECISIDFSRFDSIKSEYESFLYFHKKLERNLKESLEILSRFNLETLHHIIHEKSAIHPSLHRNHKCEYCYRSYKNRSSLNRHITESHITVDDARSNIVEKLKKK